MAAAQELCVAPYSNVSGQAAFDTIPPPCPAPSIQQPWPRPASHAVDLTLNVGLGALTAGLRAGLARRPFWPAFKRGALGGAVNYAGKRVIGTRTPALGILGRQVAAFGASAVRNAGDGRPPFSSAVLPLGPARLYVGEPGVRLKIDLAGSIALAYMAARGARLNLRSSLAAGTPILEGIGQDGPIHVAEQNAGVVAIMPGMDPYQRRRAITHELIHVAQYDFTFIAWGEPFERAVVPSLPGGRFVSRYVDIGAHMALWGFGQWLIPHDQRPWEHEAVLITDRPWP